MANRRAFIQQSTAAGVAWPTAVKIATAAKAMHVSAEELTKDRRTMHSRGPLLRGAVRRDDTILRLGGIIGCGDMTGTADDRQYAACGDGFGWFEQVVALAVACSKVCRVFTKGPLRQCAFLFTNARVQTP